MVRFDILPRLLPDSYHDTLREALEEVSRRNAVQVADDAVTQFEELPYGSYRVYTVSFCVAMDLIADGADPELLLDRPSLRTGHDDKDMLG